MARSRQPARRGAVPRVMLCPGPGLQGDGSCSVPRSLLWNRGTGGLERLERLSSGSSPPSFARRRCGFRPHIRALRNPGPDEPSSRGTGAPCFPTLTHLDSKCHVSHSATDWIIAALDSPPSHPPAAPCLRLPQVPPIGAAGRVRPVGHTEARPLTGLGEWGDGEAGCIKRRLRHFPGTVA